MKNYLGPALVAAVIILGWWAWNDIDIKKQNIEALQKQLNEVGMVLSNQCQAMLEQRGFTVEQKVEEAEKWLLK